MADLCESAMSPAATRVGLLGKRDLALISLVSCPPCPHSPAFRCSLRRSSPSPPRLQLPHLEPGLAPAPPTLRALPPRRHPPLPPSPPSHRSLGPSSPKTHSSKIPSPSASLTTARFLSLSRSGKRRVLKTIAPPSSGLRMIFNCGPSKTD